MSLFVQLHQSQCLFEMKVKKNNVYFKDRKTIRQEGEIRIWNLSGCQEKQKDCINLIHTGICSAQRQGK